jgi:hypothetical protein
MTITDYWLAVIVIGGCVGWWLHKRSSSKEDKAREALVAKVVVKKEKPKFLQFKGYDWVWPATRKNDSGAADLPEDKHVPMILLQEIRDEQREHMRLLEENVETNKELLAYMKQVFG